MRKIAHRIELSVFIKEEEAEQEKDILEALRSLVPFDLGEEKVRLEMQKAKGFNERAILIARIVLGKIRHVRAGLEHIRESLSPQQRSMILDQAHSRLDDDNNFFIRLDKRSLLDKNRLTLTDSGECFHLKIGLVAYPKTKGAALEAVTEWLG